MKNHLKTGLGILAAALLALQTAALTLETAQSGKEAVGTFATATVAATAIPAENIVPGLNVYTGTANALTFDSASDADWFTATAGVGLSVVSTDKIYGTANAALRLAVPQSGGTAFYPTLTTTLGASIDRPVALLFDFHDEYLAFQWPAGKTGYIDGGYSASKNYNVRKTNIANVASLAEMKLTGVVVASTWTTYYNYLDNIAFIPYYKITYDMPGLAADVVRYALAADDGSGNISLSVASDGTVTGFAASYAVDPSVTAAMAGAKFLGWALSTDPATVVTSVPLANADITLVPVFEKRVRPGVNVITDSASALTFDDASALQYFGKNNSDMTVSVASTSLIYGEANSALKLADSKGNGSAVYYCGLTLPLYDGALDRPAALLLDHYQGYMMLSTSFGRISPQDFWGNRQVVINARTTNVHSGNTTASPVTFSFNHVQPSSNEFVDNLAVIPYYKITYDMPGLEEDVIRYYLDSDSATGTYPAYRLAAVTVSADGAITGLPTTYTVDNTVTADGGGNATFLGWALSSDPATVVTSVALANEDVTLVPVFEGEEEAVATYSEEYGEIIFTSDLEGHTYNITNATLLGILSGGDNVAVTYDGNTGYRGYGLTQGYFYTQAWAQGGGFEFAVPGYGTPIRYADGTNVLGTLTVVFNAYNEGSASAGWYDYFKQPSYSGAYAWGDLRSAYSCGNAADTGAWNEVVYSNHYIDLPTTIIGLSQKGSRRDVVYGDVTVYVKPSNALWLTDENGEHRAFEIISGSTFTFPAAFNGETVALWTDGTDTYAAGITAAKADVANKTFRPLDAAPTLSETVDYRTTGTASGIRFRAEVSLANRLLADRYGFLVTRASFLTDGNADSLTFDLVRADGSGKPAYATGDAYVKDAESGEITTDKQSAVDDDGNVTFTGVITGIPEGHEDEVMAARPYLVVGTHTFYGGVAKATVNSAKTGNTIE